MDVGEKLGEWLGNIYLPIMDGPCVIGEYRIPYKFKEEIADHLIANGVTVQEWAYCQYVEDDVDEDNNIQAYCSVCGAGDKHATSMIGKVPYCWKCGRKMIPQPPKGE